MSDQTEWLEERQRQAREVERWDDVEWGWMHAHGPTDSTTLTKIASFLELRGTSDLLRERVEEAKRGVLDMISFGVRGGLSDAATSSLQDAAREIGPSLEEQILVAARAERLLVANGWIVSTTNGQAVVEVQTGGHRKGVLSFRIGEVYDQLESQGAVETGKNMSSTRKQIAALLRFDFPAERLDVSPRGLIQKHLSNHLNRGR
jgi:hypothetical protein